MRSGSHSLHRGPKVKLVPLHRDPQSQRVAALTLLPRTVQKHLAATAQQDSTPCRANTRLSALEAALTQPTRNRSLEGAFLLNLARARYPRRPVLLAAQDTRCCREREGRPPPCESGTRRPVTANELEQAPEDGQKPSGRRTQRAEQAEAARRGTRGPPHSARAAHLAGAGHAFEFGAALESDIEPGSSRCHAQLEHERTARLRRRPNNLRGCGARPPIAHAESVASGLRHDATGTLDTEHRKAPRGSCGRSWTALGRRR